jgi:hypothetical protein
VAVESSSEEKEEEEKSFEYDDEEMTLFIKKFKKYMNKKKFSKETRSSTQKQQPREHATIVVSMAILLIISILSIGMMVMTRRRVSSTRTRATKGVISPTRRSHMAKLTLTKNESLMMGAPTLIAMVWQLWLSREHRIQASLSSQSSIKRSTHAL